MPKAASTFSLLILITLTITQAIPALAASTERKLLRIGTGGDGGTYHPIGSLIAQAINSSELAWPGNMSNSEPILVVAQRSTGSQANVGDLANNLLEAGLAQADVVHWAYNAAGPFTKMAPYTNLRTVATLYFESVHLVAHKNSGINKVSDLVGRLVSIDELGSGTRLNTPYVLSAHGIQASQLQTVFLKPVDAMDRLRRNQLDAFFIVAGYPISGVDALVEDNIASILPIDGPGIKPLLQQYPFFAVDTIPANTYANSPAVTTLAVPAQLIVDANLDEELVYQITARLWHSQTAALLAAGHPKGRDVQFESAINGLSAPLHPGAKRYYREKAHAYFK